MNQGVEKTTRRGIVVYFLPQERDRVPGILADNRRAHGITIITHAARERLRRFAELEAAHGPVALVGEDGAGRWMLETSPGSVEEVQAKARRTLAVLDLQGQEVDGWRLD